MPTTIMATTKQALWRLYTQQQNRLIRQLTRIGLSKIQLEILGWVEDG